MKINCKQGFPRKTCFLEIIYKEGPSLLEHAEGVTKADIRLVHADQQRIGKVTLCHRKKPKGASYRPRHQIQFNFPCNSQWNSSREQAKDLMNTALDITKGKAASVEKTKHSRKTTKQIYWKIAVNDQRPRHTCHTSINWKMDFLKLFVLIVCYNIRGYITMWPIPSQTSSFEFSP